MRLLILDNKDSFTYNIVDAIRGITGSSPDVVDSASMDIARVASYSHIIFSPGPGLPAEYPFMGAVLDRYKSRKHILGVCLGYQYICEYFGASLFQLPLVCHGQQHVVEVDVHDPLYQGLGAEILVGRYHSWAIDAASLPSDLLVSGQLASGLLMSVSHNTYSIYGVQYHPESFLSEQGIQVLRNFVKLS